MVESFEYFKSSISFYIFAIMHGETVSEPIQNVLVSIFSDP